MNLVEHSLNYDDARSLSSPRVTHDILGDSLPRWGRCTAWKDVAAVAGTVPIGLR